MPISTEYQARSALRRRLEALGDDVVARLYEISHPLDLAAGQSVIMEGDPATNIYNLQRGVASVFKLLPDGRRQVTGFLYPGYFLGVTFNLEAVYAYAAETLTHCSLRVWRRTALEHLFDELPGLRQLFLAEMADELTEAQDRMLMLAHRSAEERVASFLLTMAQRQADAAGIRQDTIEIPMRWTDIADYLGTTAETVSRTLTTLRDRRTIRTGTRGAIEILDWSALEAAAEGN